MAADTNAATVERKNPQQFSAKLRDSSRTAILACLLAILCYLAAHVGGVGGILALGPDRLAPLWPGCAILLAVMLRQPKKRWPLLMVAGLAGFVLYDLSAGVSLRSIGLLSLPIPSKFLSLLLVSGTVLRDLLISIASSLLHVIHFLR